MAVTTNYGFQFLNSLLVNPGSGGGEGQPDVIGLDDGGFAVSHTHTGAHTDIGVYDVNGALTGSALVTNNGDSTDSAIAQLTDGNLVVVSEDADSVNVSIRTLSGTIVSELDIGDTPSSNADVAALTGGGFVVVSQDAFTFPDFDIDIRAYNNDGSLAFSIVVDGSSAQDTDPVVCGLDDGGFAVAWVRTVGAETEIWRAVYNGDGSVRLAPTIAYTSGSLNLAPSITAINGGFAIVHHENGWGPATTEVTLSTYDSSGTFLGEARVTDNTSNDIEATVTRLSNGYLVVASSLEFSATDYDVVLRLYDPSGTTLLATTTVEGSSENAGASSLGAIGEGAIAALWSNFTNNTVEGETQQVLRFSDSDAAGDFIFGDDFVDIMNGNAGNDTLAGGDNNDIIDGGADNDMLDGGSGLDTITGSGGADLINGSADVDSIDGGDGNDTIIVSAGDAIDGIVGGIGTDRLDLTGIVGNGAIIDFGAGTWTLSPSLGGTQSISGIEEVIGTALGDSITGGGGALLLAGAGGADTIISGNDAETMNGGLGDDSITAGFGFQTINGGDGNDTISMLDGQFIDDVTGGPGTDLLNLIDILGNGATINMVAGTWSLSPDLGGVHSILSIDNVSGTQLGDTISGNALGNNFVGNSGDDVLNGITGNDTLGGGIGNDTLNGGSGSDNVNGGAGNDRLTGSVGNDTMDGGGNNDVLIGNNGSDSLSGGTGLDDITGGAGNDTINGGDGNDTLAGGANVDRITGGIGADILSGNSGSDRFIYTDIAESTVALGGRDTIIDFNENAADRIDLSLIDANAVGGGANDAFVFIGAGAFTGLGQVRAFQSGADTFVEMNTTGSNAADMRIVLTGVNVLDALDFFL